MITNQLHSQIDSARYLKRRTDALYYKRAKDYCAFKRPVKNDTITTLLNWIKGAKGNETIYQ